jgi:hypothetical protein
MTLDTKTKIQFTALPADEHSHQKSFFDELHTFVMPDYPEVHPLMFAVPNGIPLFGGIKQRSAVINKMKAEGMTPGVADILFLSGRGGHFGLAMEMKTPERRNTKDGGLSEAQQEFLYAARMEGFKTVATYGSDDAMQTVKEYLAMPRTQDMVWKALRYLEKGNAEAAKLLLKEITLAWE